MPLNAAGPGSSHHEAIDHCLRSGHRVHDIQARVCAFRHKRAPTSGEVIEKASEFRDFQNVPTAAPLLLAQKATCARFVAATVASAKGEEHDAQANRDTRQGGNSPVGLLRHRRLAGDGACRRCPRHGRHRLDPDLHGPGPVHDLAGPRALLRRPGANQERSLGADAVLCVGLSHHSPVAAVRVQPGIRQYGDAGRRHQFQILHWRPVEGLHAGPPSSWARSRSG